MSFFARQAERFQIAVDRRPAHLDPLDRQALLQLVERQVRLACHKASYQLLMRGQSVGLSRRRLCRRYAARAFPALHQLDRAALADREPLRCRSPRQTLPNRRNDPPAKIQ